MRPAVRRGAVAAAAAVVAVVDMTVKAWAQAGLPAGGLEGGPVDLRLAYNTGVAFSAGDGAPTWAVVAVTAGITLAVAVYAWRVAARGAGGPLAALALVLGGAVANLVDRAVDGRVTDYLHTGWWPTFNLADTAIVTGGLLLAALAWRSGAADDQEQVAAAPSRREDSDG